MRAVIACGGTGGHLFPGIAVAQAMGRRGHQSLLLISEKEIDSLAARDHPELEFVKVPAIGMPRLLSPKLLPFFVRFWRTLRRTKAIVRDFQADAVLGMGGFTSLPPVLAGRSAGACTFIHESNAIPGKANRLTARFTNAVLLGLDAAVAAFPGRRCHVVGTPLRDSMHRKAGRDDACRFFGLSADKQTILVMGGSQGAHGVNVALAEAAATLDPARMQIIALTGSDDEALVRDAMARRGLTAFVAPFSPRLDLAYAIADVCVARSGGSSLAELAHFGIPAILIPYPFAADDHQTRNAEVFTRQGAALMIRQDSLPGGALGESLASLLTDAARRDAMSQAIQSLDFPDAAERISDVIEAAVSGRPSRR